MSDLFQDEVPTEFIQQVFDTMKQAEWHIFQVLTKRPDRMRQLAPQLPWPPNVWMGVSVESPRWGWRIDELRQVPASVRFLSCEPLLRPLSLDLRGIDWVIVGGESGPRARPMKLEWVQSIREQCVQAGVAFFFKQWGGVHKKRTGRVLDGRVWNERPLGRKSS